MEDIEHGHKFWHNQKDTIEIKLEKSQITSSKKIKTLLGVTLIRDISWDEQVSAQVGRQTSY